jgi:hypothetical protein
VTPSPALTDAAQSPTPEERLERGDVLFYPTCPFRLPEGDDRRFLLEQELAGRAHKNVSYNPHSGKAGGYRATSAARAERLRALLADFSATATAWLRQALPRYAGGWELDRVSFRPVEESTRKVRMSARNDLIHVDSFPTRPTHGRRILRLFANVNPTEPRVWATSDPFARLLERYGRDAGLPRLDARGWLRQGLLRILLPLRPRGSAYDDFMHRFHNFLKANADFQAHGPKRLWTFPPGSAWTALTDTCSHAALRGRFALEHSYFIVPSVLALPAESPPALLERLCGLPVLGRAA